MAGAYRTRGFTLVELMIVIAIIGILAAIAIPVYSNYVAKAQFTEALSLASGIKTAVADGYQQRETLYGLNNGVGAIPKLGETGGTYVSHIEVKNGYITAYFGEDSALAGASMTLVPTTGGRVLQWRCTTTAERAKAPANCDQTSTPPAYP